jgi:2-aminoethylphosphonate-pyruvate transaminase
MRARCRTAIAAAGVGAADRGLVHCETSTGILNPLQAIAEVVARHGRG